MEQQDWLTGQGIANFVGFKSKKTVWLYLSRGILPKPELYLDNKPIWSKSTIEKWNSERKSLVIVSDKASDKSLAAATEESESPSDSQ